MAVNEAAERQRQANERIAEEGALGLVVRIVSYGWQAKLDTANKLRMFMFGR